MEVNRRSWIIGEGNGTLWSLAFGFFFYRALYRKILIAFSSASSSVLSKVFPLISLFFWCHMYDALVYKMLWDRKNLLNISYGKLLD
jgi:hypothetical protein